MTPRESNLGPEPLIDATEVAKFLGLAGPKSVHTLARRRRLPVYRLGPKTMRFRLSEVQAALDRLFCDAVE